MVIAKFTKSLKDWLTMSPSAAGSRSYNDLRNDNAALRAKVEALEKPRSQAAALQEIEERAAAYRASYEGRTYAKHRAAAKKGLRK